jgi:hypothetical protein
MTQDMRNWVRWVRILVDPNEEQRGFTLADLEFKAQPDVVEDEMYGTRPGDNNTQAGKFYVVTEEELMRVCPQMKPFAQSADWFFPVEFCDSLLRPEGVEPVQTRDATPEEKAAAEATFESVQEQSARRDS